MDKKKYIMPRSERQQREQKLLADLHELAKRWCEGNEAWIDAVTADTPVGKEYTHQQEKRFAWAEEFNRPLNGRSIHLSLSDGRLYKINGSDATEEFVVCDLWESNEGARTFSIRKFFHVEKWGRILDEQ